MKAPDFQGPFLFWGRGNRSKKVKEVAEVAEVAEVKEVTEVKEVKEVKEVAEVKEVTKVYRSITHGFCHRIGIGRGDRDPQAPRLYYVDRT
ncbi:MAG: hypothetical protein KDC28_02475 [Saprospiraceae bacterium]|nr:hypothetical protein [Saprospiraceae bacterium]MCB9321898.1 hypothetical protein [Lewinellaceae bacterium]